MLPEMEPAVESERARDREPFFGPASLTRRINRESVLLLGGPRALLLQLAHPLVAQGVADHSGFLGDPLGRLRRTLDAMLGIAFGDHGAASRIAAQICQTHDRVHGRLQEGTASFAAGTPYDAHDPELGLWVFATLVDSALEVYGRVVAPLSRQARAAYYEESKRVALLLGVPAEVLPETFQGLELYLREMIEGPDLEITPTARRMADAVLHPPIPLVPRIAGDAASVITCGLLPSAIRERYGLAWGARRERAFGAIMELVRRALPLMPGLIRRMPHARRAAGTTG
jgi:uncharacterized protein (DUF2236 family)